MRLLGSLSPKKDSFNGLSPALWQGIAVDYWNYESFFTGKVFDKLLVAILK